MDQLVNPFSILAVEEKPEAPLRAAEKKEKDEKKLKQKQRPRRRPASSTPNSNGGQNQRKVPADSVSVSISTSLNDDQTKESKREEAEKNTKEGDHDPEGWQLVQHQTRKKKGPRNGGNHPQSETEEKQGAVVNNHVDVEEGIKQLQEAAREMNGSQSVEPKKPNMNGSARRKLQKKKDGAGQDQQVQDNKEAAVADATETAPPEKKFTVMYTLKEFEMMKSGHSNKSEDQPHQPAEKKDSFRGRYAENSFKGRRNQKGGNKFNGDAKDVSPATEEKAEELSFTLVPAEFPALGKAL